MKKQAFFALAIVAAAGCSSAPREDENTSSNLPTDGVTETQKSAFTSLQQTTKQSWVWIQHDKYKTPMHLDGSRNGMVVLKKNANVEKTTVDFVTEHKSLFKMREPARELVIEKTEKDELGMTHARFQQVTHGVPVVGAELAAHYDKQGHVASIQANYIPDLDGLDLNPAFEAKSALGTVKADILGKMVEASESDLIANDGKLVVFALEGKPAKLAYEYTVRAMVGQEPAIWVTTVDAKTGEIIDQFNNLQTIEASGQGITGAQKFQVTQSGGGGYVMTDTSLGVSIRTYSAQQAQTTPGSLVTSASLTSWDTGVTGAGAAVDAHAYATVVAKYYKDKHARNAIDGAGGAMISTAHYGTNYDNAFWDGTGMSYGDGGTAFKPLSAGLDVVAHEFSHGVTERTSGLRYQNQSGALNEAFSDIISSYVEAYAKPDPTNNWLLGELVGRNGPLRNMKDPAKGNQPANMAQYRQTTQDNGGVHINSGIINNAAYLMTMGGTNPAGQQVQVKYGIGIEKAEKLWYRANTKYFLQTTNFAQAAAGVLQAAKDVGLTENETNIVDCAWKAVGVTTGTCATLTDPKSTTPPTTPGSDPTNPDGTGDTTNGDGTTEETTEEEQPTTAKKPRRTVTQTSDSGCNAGAGKADLTPFAGLLAAVVGLALGRRRKKD